MIRFPNCSNICISGGTGCGKTVFTFKLLTSKDAFPTQPQKILYCFGIYQDLFDKMKAELPQLTLHEGLPDTATLKQFADGQHNLVVLDDLMSKVVQAPEMEQLFVQFSHHLQLSVIFLCQNCFVQGRYSRTIFLNMHILILFKTMRGGSQIAMLGRDLYPGRGDVVTQAYADATAVPFGYLVVDMAPHSEDQYRLRTRIFPDDGETIVYVHVPNSIKVPHTMKGAHMQ